MAVHETIAILGALEELKLRHNDYGAVRAERDRLLTRVRELQQELDTQQPTDAWRQAALRVGEEIAEDGPNGYYSFTPEQWREWALGLLALDR